MRYKRIAYNIVVMQQSACLVVNAFTVNSCAVLFYFMPMGRGLDSMIAQHKANNLVSLGWTFVFFLAH